MTFEDMKPNYEEQVLKLKNSPYVNKKTIDEFLSFIRSGEPLVKPENPAHHFCSFFLPVHEESKSVYLVHHIKAGSWIPPGGHIEPKESPIEAVRREFAEELRVPITNEKINLFNLTVSHIENSQFLCRTHFDFWYAVFTDKTNFRFDKKEFYDAGWFPINKAIKMVTFPTNIPVFKRILDSWEMLTQ